MLGSNFEVKNFGVSGSNALLDAPYPYLSNPALREALAFQPNVVVVMLGTNDASIELEPYFSNFEQDYTMLIQKFQALPTKPLIWLAKPPHIHGEMHGLSNQILEQYINPSIEQVAKRECLPLIDVHSALSSLGFFLDGVHPNDLGAKAIAEAIYRAIKPRL
jgi:lysophospholipase L1-like esterase